MALQKLISRLTPTHCISCRVTGNSLCDMCKQAIITPLVSVCYRCNSLTNNNKTCKSCRASSPIHSIWFAGAYKDETKKLIHEMKFKERRSAATDIAACLDLILPIIDPSIVTYIPTATSRIRRRGFDHAALIAQHLSKARNWQFEQLLVRQTQSRQVGSTRLERKKHMLRAFRVRNEPCITDATVLLIDDVLSTGATIEGAAYTLKQAGAKQVIGAIFAKS